MTNEWKALADAAMVDLRAALETSGEEARKHLSDASHNIDAAISTLEDEEL